MNRIKPRNDWVLVEARTIGKTKGGLLLPDRSKEAKQLIVLGIGDKVEGVRVGDEVLVNEENQTYQVGKDLWMVQEASVFALVEGEDE